MIENIYNSDEYKKCVSLIEEYHRNKKVYTNIKDIDSSIIFSAEMMKAMISLKRKLDSIGPGWLEACETPLKILSLLKDVAEILYELKNIDSDKIKESHYKGFEIKDETIKFAVNVFNVKE